MTRKHSCPGRPVGVHRSVHCSGSLSLVSPSTVHNAHAKQILAGTLNDLATILNCNLCLFSYFLFVFSRTHNLKYRAHILCNILFPLSSTFLGSALSIQLLNKMGAGFDIFTSRSFYSLTDFQCRIKARDLCLYPAPHSPAWLLELLSKHLRLHSSLQTSISLP
jgi:hypothetical protein